MFVTCQFALSWAVGRTSHARYCTLHELSHDCIAVKVRREGDFSSLAVEKDAMEEKCLSGKHSTACIAYRCCGVVRLKAFAEHVQGGGASASGVCSIPFVRCCIRETSCREKSRIGGRERYNGSCSSITVVCKSTVCEHCVDKFAGHHGTCPEVL